MLKKIALGGLLAGLVAVLVLGAVNRTNARNSEEAGDGGRRGQTAEVAAAATAEGYAGRWAEDGSDVRGQGGGRWAQGEGAGQAGEYSVPQADVQPEEWLAIQGTVVNAETDLIEIETATGEIIPFEGRPLSFAQEEGFSLDEGDAVTLSGFDEDGEFKIGQVTNLTDGLTITLRDASGRPGWAGRGGRS